MSHKKTNSIAIALLIALGIVFIAILGLLLNLLAGQLASSPWLSTQSWYTLHNLLLALVAVIFAAIIVAIWQYFASKDASESTSRLTIGEMLLERYENAVREGQIAKLDTQKLKAELDRQAEELLNLQQQVAIRSSEPPEAQLSKFLEAGDLDAALRLKSKQVESRRKESANLPRDLYELGIIHELRFEWPQALAAFREAWEIGHDTDHGFKYALFAANLNHFKEAIAAYEALLRICEDPHDRARALNNIAILYKDTQRMKEAEQSYAEALSYYRKLAESNPDAYMHYIAGTLNNLGLLFSATQRMKEAEQLYAEAIAIYRKLAETDPEAYMHDAAMTLNNLAILYKDTQRMKQAEHAYSEALDTYYKLTEANPDEYRPYVATTLNNLAALHYANQRMKEAEEAYTEVLDLRRKLAETNPDTYMSGIATTLNNLAALYYDTQRTKQAEDTLVEALTTYRKLAEANSEVYMPYIAITLNNLAIFYLSMDRIQEAEARVSEAECIIDPLWHANPALHGNQMARTLWNHAEIAQASRQPTSEVLPLARRALAAAYDQALKQSIQELIDRLSPGSQS